MAVGTPMMPPEPAALHYDVALSFLSDDVAAAKAIADTLDGQLRVFFYLRKQEELVGTDGLETMRKPFIDARIVVVLYRSKWGQTPWTSVEETAIKEKCLNQGWPIIFVRLDKNDPWPRWVSDTRIHFDWHQFPLQELIGAIKMRVQAAGGAIQTIDAVARAKQVKAHGELKADQGRLFRNQEFIDKTARPQIVSLMDHLCREAQRINDDAGFDIEYGHEPYSSLLICVLRQGRVTTQITWKQQWSNVVEDVALECKDFNARVYLYREQRIPFREPQAVGSKSYRMALNYAREACWIEPAKPDHLMSNDELVQRILEQLLALVDRVNRGNLPEPKHF